MIEVVPVALDGERVNRVVSLLTGMTRSQVASLVDQGEVHLNQVAVKARSRRVAAGETLEVPDAVAPVPAEPAAEPDVIFRVVHADAAVIVVDKPAGLVVHPGAGHQAGTMVGGLLARFPDLAALAVDGAESRPGIVHRLDKGTSGLLVVARTAAARTSLQAQMASRAAERRYQALVWGTVESNEGLIDAPIRRAEADPTRMAIRAGGKRGADPLPGRPALHAAGARDLAGVPAGDRSDAPDPRPPFRNRPCRGRRQPLPPPGPLAPRPGPPGARTRRPPCLVTELRPPHDGGAELVHLAPARRPDPAAGPVLL